MSNFVSLKSLHWEGMKFGQLILRRVVEIVATKCQILRLKRTKIDVGWAPPQTPMRELTALPETP